MSLDGGWVPEDEEEDHLMEDLYIATRRAHKRGVSKRRIASLLAFMASATLDPRSDGEAPDDAERASMEEAMDEGESQTAPDVCPDCGVEVSGVMAEMGGKVHLKPCDHTFDGDDAKPFHDRVTD